MFKRYLQDQAATEAFGGQLAAACKGGLLVFLHGHLGAGKTTLVRGFLRASGHSGPVKSPTYALIEPYITASVKVRESHEVARPLPFFARSHKLTEQFEELHANTLGDF